MFRQVKTIQQEIQSRYPIIQTVLDGNQQGIIFQSGNCYFVEHKAGFCQLLGNPISTDGLENLLSTQLSHQYFHIYEPNSLLLELIRSLESKFNYKLRNRIQLEYDGPTFEISCASGYSVKDLDSECLDKIAQFQLDLTSRFWNNKQDLLNKALGSLMVDSRNEPMAICYSAANALGKAEVDVKTLEQYQGKGLGKIVTKHFINRCLFNNLKPNWDCFDTNLSSLNVALKLGFTERHKYAFLSVFNNQKTKTP